MIAKKEDDRVFLEAVLLELTQYLSRLPVHGGHKVVSMRPLFPDRGRVGIEGGQADCGRVVRWILFQDRAFPLGQLISFHSDPGFMRNREVENCEKGLLFIRPIAEVSLVATLVPGRGWRLEIVI